MFDHHSSRDNSRPRQVRQRARHETMSNKAAFVPWVCAFFAGAISISLLPSFIKGPAIVGAIFCGVTGLVCIAGWYFLRKGANYHARKRSQGVDPDQAYYQNHPVQRVALPLMLCGLAAFVTQGAYLYMVVSVIIAESGTYCVTMTPGTSLKSCETGSGGGWLGVQVALLIGVSGFAWLYHSSIEKETKTFDENRERHYEQHGMDPYASSSGGGGGGRGYQDNDQVQEEYEDDWRSEKGGRGY
ncbi:hypothetical protein JCM8097_004188 [Rhodosporidiobolus ruineniae]